MVSRQDWTIFEKVSIFLSLILFIVGTAELTDLINLLPMYVYLLVLWVLALSVWLHRRQLS